MVFTRCRSILVGKLPYAPEGQERAEAQCGRRMCINQRIADEQPVFISLEDKFLFQHYPTHSVERGRHFVAIKLANVFMPLRAVVVALILVQSKVKLGTVLNDGDVERREQDMVLVVELGNRHDQQTMIFSRVTLHNG